MKYLIGLLALSCIACMEHSSEELDGEELKDCQTYYIKRSYAKPFITLVECPLKTPIPNEPQK